MGERPEPLKGAVAIDPDGVDHGRSQGEKQARREQGAQHRQKTSEGAVGADARWSLLVLQGQVSQGRINKNSLGEGRGGVKGRINVPQRAPWAP